jgi:hypothetical protein
MAGIDKTYISNWEVFDKVRNWAKEQIIPVKYGNAEKLSDYLYYPDLTKKEWNEMHKEQIQYAKEHYNNPEHEKQCKELYGNDWVFDPENYFCVTLWNTPTFIDIWLIKNCPFEEIQDRLKEQYGGGWSKLTFTDHNESSMYDQIKKGISIYDTYQRNGLGKSAKIKFQNIHGNWIRDKKLRWWITIESPHDFWYNEDTNSWHQDEELMPITSNVCHFNGTLTKKNIINLIKKWDLPKGTILRFEVFLDKYSMHEFYVIVK